MFDKEEFFIEKKFDLECGKEGVETKGFCGNAEEEPCERELDDGPTKDVEREEEVDWEIKQWHG